MFLMLIYKSGLPEAHQENQWQLAILSPMWIWEIKTPNKYIKEKHSQSKKETEIPESICGCFIQRFHQDMDTLMSLKYLKRQKIDLISKTWLDGNPVAAVSALSVSVLQEREQLTFWAPEKAW